MNTWSKLGVPIEVVLPRGEGRICREDFPMVSVWHETDKCGEKFNCPHHVRVSALAELAVDEPVLIINSDIEIIQERREFLDSWRWNGEDVLRCGVRWDYDEHGRMHLLKWGIDAFRITPPQAKQLPDIGMTIGCPAWDYWIPYHLWTCGHEIKASTDKSLRHELHKVNWSQQQYDIGLGIMREKYHLTQGMLSLFIQEATGRTKLRPWRTAALCHK
jgi:hypothetical protein